VYNFIDPLAVCVFILKSCASMVNNLVDAFIYIYITWGGGRGRNIRHDPQGTKGGSSTPKYRSFGIKKKVGKEWKRDSLEVGG